MQPRLVGFALLALPIAASAPAQAPLTPRTETFTWMAPLERMADEFQQLYAKPITYEDPIWRWRGDSDVLGTDRLGQEIIGLKVHTLVLPEELRPDRMATLGVAELTKVLAAYREQNPERARFRAAESGMWLQIIPAEAHDETGAFRPAGSLLDIAVSVPVASRTPTEHLIALCDAITAANPDHYTVRPNSSAKVGGPFDQLFAANGYILRRNLRNFEEPTTDDDERPYVLTDWGATARPAREALTDFLSRSGTTATWRLKCAPDAKICILNVQPLIVAGANATIRVRSLDRCWSCRPVPVRSDARQR
ncbi:MAG TPA: hypothetical protein VMU19_09070 [Bryobacteraceae bacterium]|nr:hypothetical protein [Bryobacteraceae bacterium]